MLLHEASASLTATVEELERGRWAAELWAPDWRLMWVSTELKTALGEHDDERLGVGTHWLESRWNPTWVRRSTEGSRRRALSHDLPYIAAETPGGKEALRELAGPELAGVLDDLVPAEAPPIWTFSVNFIQGSLPPVHVVATATRLRDERGERLGTVAVYAPGLPPAVVTLVARGDRGMLQRMARLIEPGRHLFADLQSSSALSRRLSSASYFGLIRALTTAIDAAVIERLGIVGRHAGDESPPSSWPTTSARRRPRRERRSRPAGRLASSLGRWPRSSTAGTGRSRTRTFA